jgi:uncharacterized protein YbjT (DUF2867 family)
VVLAELTARGKGHALVDISRSPESVRSPAEGRPGDYDRPETLLSAYQDLDRLVIIPGAELSPGVCSRQLESAIDAAVKAGEGEHHPMPLYKSASSRTGISDSRSLASRLDARLAHETGMPHKSS